MRDGEETRSGSEPQLAAALRAGDPAAIAALHAGYLDRVFGYVLRRVPQREDAEDITAEVFAAAARAAGTFRQEAGLFVWLIGIARRKIADHRRRGWWRREVRQGDLPGEPPLHLAGALWETDLPDESLCRGEVARAVRAAIARLPAPQREAILLQFAEGLTLQEIGRVLRRSEDGVKALLRRARAALLAHLMTDPTVAPGPGRAEAGNAHVHPAPLEP